MPSAEFRIFLTLYFWLGCPALQSVINVKFLMADTKVDWRTFSAARIAHVSPATVKREKTFFKKHFAQCLQAWKCDFGK